MRTGIGPIMRRALRFPSSDRPYYVALVIVVTVLLWMALASAVRAGMFDLTGALTSQQITLLATLVMGGFGTAASIIASLLTRDHNARDRRRLRLEDVMKSVEMLPPEHTMARVAGCLSAMLLLGHSRIAIRVLEPAWDKGHVDDGTATWVIDQLLIGDDDELRDPEGDRADDAVIIEAAMLLANRADRLIDRDKGRYYFPGHFLQSWDPAKKLPLKAKEYLLLAMGRMLVSPGRDWWCRDGDLPFWPTSVLLQCAEEDDRETIRSSAAVLAGALQDLFPEVFREHLSAERLDALLQRAEDRTKYPVPTDYLLLAERIKSDWKTPAREDAPLGGVTATS